MDPFDWVELFVGLELLFVAVWLLRFARKMTTIRSDRSTVIASTRIAVLFALAGMRASTTIEPVDFVSAVLMVPVVIAVALSVRKVELDRFKLIDANVLAERRAESAKDGAIAYTYSLVKEMIDAIAGRGR